MKNNNPPFVITGRMLAAAADIAEQVGRLSVADPLAANPTLRRSNRIRTIHGSLAIEQNTLSLEQVTAVLGGKHVLAPPKDIAEVKNAYEIYDRLDELDPYAVDDLLLAHGVMMRGLVEEAGVFRSQSSPLPCTPCCRSLPATFPSLNMCARQASAIPGLSTP